MSVQDTTLRHILCQQKPLIPCQMKAGKSTTNGNWPEIEDSVTVWEDFSLSTLNNSYGHILDHVVSEQLLTVPQPEHELSNVAIRKIEDTKHLISWNSKLIQVPLQFAKSYLELYSGIIPKHSYSTADKSTIATLPGQPAQLVVDHIIFLDNYPRLNLVVGLGKPSAMWSGRILVNEILKPTKVSLWPLRQLANICKKAGTRYGYIQTDEDLVACCFSQNGDNPNHWRVAIMPVPWSKHGVGVLTTDLALWWLCMLAMSQNNSSGIVEEGQIVRINDWKISCPDEERGYVRRHSYSGVEIAMSPDDWAYTFDFGDKDVHYYG